MVTVTPWDINSSKTTRNLTFTQTMGMNQLNGKFLINGVSFDMSKVNYTIPLNNIEIWELTNQSGIAHPFHIHDVQFNILTRGGVAPKANEKGWKDVVLVQPMETVRFITKFEDFANDSVPYMYHCHLLRHEDDGMMGQFVVVDSQNTVSINPELKESSITIYPNPSNGVVNLEVKDGSIIEVIKVFNILGQSLESAKINKNVAEIILPKTNGIYTVLVRMDNQYYSEKVVVR